MGLGPARATFTVAGSFVTLRVGETRQVGQSLIHLASVEDNVAKFSVDFSGLFLHRADLRDASGGQLSTYASYVEVTDDQDVVTFEVPVEWDDVDGREDPEFGPSVVAARDLEQFGRTWNEPGILVEVSSRYGADDSGEVLDQFGPSEQCASEGREAYNDRRFSGEIERWTGCDEADTTVVAAAIAPADGGFLLVVFGQAVDARDLAAFDRVLATVDVSALGAARSQAGASSEAAAPSEAIVTETDWLRNVKALRTEIDDAIAGTGSELTGPVLTDMATAMRACTRTLESAGPPSTRLERLHTLVEKACSEYDEGADCLATAAEIGTPDGGSAEDRRMTEALNCGFDALNRGSELLIDAETAADDLRAAQPG